MNVNIIMNWSKLKECDRNRNGGRSGNQNRGINSNRNRKRFKKEIAARLEKEPKK